MEWDYEKIEAAVCTLTEALGTICDVSVEFKPESEETGELLYGLPVRVLIPGTEKTIITITPKEES